jgi:hypothetical protein
MLQSSLILHIRISIKCERIPMGLSFKADPAIRNATMRGGIIQSLAFSFRNQGETPAGRLKSA